TNSWLAAVLAMVMCAAYVLMALVEEAWLEERYGASYRDYCECTARFLDVPAVAALIDRKKISDQTS
ncbi:MAG: hypothetical protein ABWZ01_01645, partial [Methyloceanibacter sp.]